MADTWVRITHPDLDGIATVADRSLPHWLARGWAKAPPPPPPPAPKPAVKAPAPAAVAPPDQAAPKPADNPKDEG